MKFIFYTVFFIGLLLSNCLLAQTVFTSWNFETSIATPASPATNVGTGAASVINNGTGTITAASGTGMSTLTGCGAQTSGTNAWALNPFASGNATETNGVQFLTSTTGYTNIFFTWEQRSSNAVANTWRLQYTLNGTSWVNFIMSTSNTTFCNGVINAAGAFENNTAGDNYRRITADFTAITAANNNTNFGVRILAATFTTTNQFRQTSNTSTVATAGTVRFDNVSFAGTTAIANTPPTIVLDAVNTPYTIVGNAANPLSPFGIADALTDPTSAIQNTGVAFVINDAETALNALTVSATSSNTAVVPNANITITGSGANRNIKINPTAVGVANIIISVNDGTSTTSYTISYAVSAAPLTTTNTRFLHGSSDGSTAIAIDNNTMLVADDENQALRLYNRQNSGLPYISFDFTTSLGLTDLSGGLPREVDIEASTKVGNRIYWLGSHSNAASGNARPNRSRLFATDLTSNGANSTLTYVGRYDNLKTDIINWDLNNTHGLGANYFGLQASATTGVLPEASDGSGFNIEGLEMAPDNTTAFVCFRAPQTLITTRTMALVIPVTNFTTLVAANPYTATSATFGSPIQLNLGGRGIREIRKNADNEYLIIAGPCDAATGTAPKDFKLFIWNGIATSNPILVNVDLTALQVNGSFEGILNIPTALFGNCSVQLIVDNGDFDYYNTGVAAKDLSDNNLKKSRVETVNFIIPVVLPLNILNLSASVINQNHVYITFTAATNSNVTLHKLMVSTDGVNFRVLNNSVILSNNIYNYKHLNAFVNTTALYYKIQTLYTNGEVVNSQIIKVVKNAANNAANNVISINQQEATNVVLITINQNITQPMPVLVINTNGAVIKKFNINSSGTYNINLSTLPKGSYIFKVGNNFVKKIIKY